jgi:predicted RNA-binding Zn-ribbon protein involved in translation (DUF1610 family)
MTTIFVLHTQEDAVYAKTIQQDLEEEGYTSVHAQSFPDPGAVKNAILGSAAIVLVWSSSAAQSKQVKQEIRLAQQLKKLIVPLVFDGTTLPQTMVGVSSITSQTSGIDAVVQFLPQLPGPQSTDSLIRLYEQAAHEYIRERRAAIERAAEMLQRDEQREAVLAVLDYLAHYEPTMLLCEKAQEVLATAQGQTSPTSTVPPVYVHKENCPNCGYVNVFDKREICKTDGIIVKRRLKWSGDKELDELTGYKCKKCGKALIVHVDCEGYKK